MFTLVGPATGIEAVAIDFDLWWTSSRRYGESNARARLGKAVRGPPLYRVAGTTDVGNLNARELAIANSVLRLGHGQFGPKPRAINHHA